mmetsp:Transcript_23454/g.31425  ORF Transcript_23454/g.31425 Transcript_23454/m.31425 type:complete len:97 (-) Transcript_23454:775-1065(-)
MVGDQSFKIAERQTVSVNTATFTFKSLSGIPVSNLKRWYSDPAMIGRHFLVYSKSEPRIKRQYTICSSMNPKAMKPLLELASTVINGKKEPSFDWT